MMVMMISVLFSMTDMALLSKQPMGCSKERHTGIQRERHTHTRLCIYILDTTIKTQDSLQDTECSLRAVSWLDEKKHSFSDHYDHGH